MNRPPVPFFGNRNAVTLAWASLGHLLFLLIFSVVWGDRWGRLTKLQPKAEDGNCQNRRMRHFDPSLKIGWITSWYIIDAKWKQSREKQHNKRAGQTATCSGKAKHRRHHAKVSATAFCIFLRAGGCSERKLPWAALWTMKWYGRTTLKRGEKLNLLLWWGWFKKDKLGPEVPNCTYLFW